MRRTQREEAQRQAVQQAQKASYRHRSRFQRALGGPTGADASAAELGCEDYDGMPEDSSGQPADRSTILHCRPTTSMINIPCITFAARPLSRTGPQCCVY